MVHPDMEADEAWYADDNGVFCRSISTWKRSELEYTWTSYMARFGERWLLFIARFGKLWFVFYDNGKSDAIAVVEVASSEAAKLALEVIR